MAGSSKAIGDKYGYVAAPLARHGIITAVMSYRLAPFRYPSQVEDVELAVAWLAKNIGARGGDPHRIFVGGHSAGAILSALLGVRTNWQAARGVPADVIKGIVPVSGPYDLRTLAGFVANFIPTDGPIALLPVHCCASHARRRRWWPTARRKCRMPPARPRSSTR